MPEESVSSRLEIPGRTLLGFVGGLIAVLSASLLWQLAVDGTSLESYGGLAAVFLLVSAALLVVAGKAGRGPDISPIAGGVRWGVSAAWVIAAIVSVWLIFLGLTLGS